MNLQMNEIETRVKEQFSNGYNCSQIVAAFFAEKYGIDEEQIRRIACGFGGGMRKGEVCGAVTGALMVIGMREGRGNDEEKARKNKCYEEIVDFESRFVEKEGTLLCRELLGCNIAVPEEYQEAARTNLFLKICPRMITVAIEVLLEMGY